MKEELIKQACIKAGNYYRDGYNCAESLFLTFMEYTDSKASPELVRLATPFGGGLGHSGCSCGALTGAVLVIGLFKGRITTAESKKLPTSFLQNIIIDLKESLELPVAEPYVR